MKQVEVFIRGIADLVSFKGIYSLILKYKETERLIYDEIECNNYVKRRKSIEDRAILEAMCKAVSILKEPCKITFYCYKDISEILFYIDNLDLINKFNKLICDNNHYYNIVKSDDNQSRLHEYIFKNNIPTQNTSILEDEEKEYIYYIYDYIYKKYYVGKSRNINHRWREHKRFGARGYENNTHYISKKGLYVSMKMNGINNFLFRVIESCDGGYISRCREKSWISKLNSINNGYNVIHSFHQLAALSNGVSNEIIKESEYKEKIHEDIVKYHEKYIKPLDKSINRKRKNLDLDKIKTQSWIIFKITSKITNEYYINCRNKVSIEHIKYILKYRMYEKQPKEGSLSEFIQKHNSIDELTVEILEYIEGDIDKYSIIRKWCNVFGTEYATTNYLLDICNEE